MSEKSGYGNRDVDNAAQGDGAIYPSMRELEARARLQDNSGDTIALQDLVESLLEQKKPDEAAMFQRRYCELFPEVSEGWQQLAVCYELAGHIDEAIDALKTAIGIDTNHIEARLALGEIYLEHEDFDDAIDAVDPAIDAVREKIAHKKEVPSFYGKLWHVKGRAMAGRDDTNYELLIHYREAAYEFDDCTTLLIDYAECLMEDDPDNIEEALRVVRLAVEQQDHENIVHNTYYASLLYDAEQYEDAYKELDLLEEDMLDMVKERGDIAWVPNVFMMQAKVNLAMGYAKTALERAHLARLSNAVLLELCEFLGEPDNQKTANCFWDGEEAAKDKRSKSLSRDELRDIQKDIDDCKSRIPEIARLIAFIERKIADPEFTGDPDDDDGFSQEWRPDGDGPDDDPGALAYSL